MLAGMLRHTGPSSPGLNCIRAEVTVKSKGTEVEPEKEVVCHFKNDALAYLEIKDIYTGLLKALIFGTVIATVGCSQGLRARGGAIGVGQAPRQTVVISYLLIISLGYYVTYLFYYVRW